MQILVVVAIIQVRLLKAEVEKGSMRTVFVHGLAGPKGMLCSARTCVSPERSTGQYSGAVSVLR